MKKFLLILGILLLPVAGYYAFTAGWMVIRTFIGMMLISIFVLGIIVGRISKR
jgi:VIT1/CCC1 family predicted Fe2+/Mn2+ transporter